MDVKNTFVDLGIPHYGYYGGAGWGIRDRYKAWGQPLNQPDEINFQHDQSCPPCASGVWASNQFSSNPNFLPAGPFGMAYQLLGLVPFTIAGAMGH